MSINTIYPLCRWDEWVTEDRMRPNTEEYIEQMRQIREKNKIGNLKNSKKTSSKTSTSTKKISTGTASTQTPAIETRSEFAQRMEIHLPLPTKLKLQLIDDFDRISRQKQQVPLPRNPTARHIFEQYQSERLKELKQNRNDSVLNVEQVKEFVRGLQSYFEKALGTLLLYRIEREQYADVHRGNIKPSASQENMEDGERKLEMVDVYGAEHLLRLFVKLPSLLVFTDLNEDETRVLKEHLSHFLVWMTNKQSDLFVKQYETIPPSYLNAMKN